jgi:hexokinase
MEISVSFWLKSYCTKKLKVVQYDIRNEQKGNNSERRGEDSMLPQWILSGPTKSFLKRII